MAAIYSGGGAGEDISPILECFMSNVVICYLPALVFYIRLARPPTLMKNSPLQQQPCCCNYKDIRSVVVILFEPLFRTCKLSFFGICKFAPGLVVNSWLLMLLKLCSLSRDIRIGF